MMLQFEKGITLIELVVTVAVIGILAAIGVPSYLDFVKKQELIGASEAVYNTIQYARSESIANGADVYFAFKGTGSTGWCLGVSDTAPCDCAASLAACTINSAQARSVSGQDYPNISLTTSFNIGVNHYSGFSAPRMIPFDNGSVSISYPGFAGTSVVVSTIGRVKLCSGTLSSYSGC